MIFNFRKDSCRLIANVLCVFLLVFACTLGSQAQDVYPNKPIKLIVGFGAGGGTDVVARIVAESMSKSLGRPVVVENRVGAGARIATAAVSRAAPDGYTLLFNTMGQVLMPALYKDLPFNPDKDLIPVGMVGEVPHVMVVSKDLGVNDLQSLIGLLRANPNKYAFGSSGVGTITHVSGELFKKLTNTQVTHVPYTGEPQTLNDLIAGRLAFVVTTVSSIPPFLESGKVVAIVSPSDKRSDRLPAVPTSAEAGIPGYYSYTFNMILAPRETPRPIVDRLNRALNLALIETAHRLKAMGLDVMPMTPDELRKYLENEASRWRPVVEAAGIAGQ